MLWQRTTVIARRISMITTPHRRQNQHPLFLRHPMTPSVPWIAAPRDISGAEPLFHQTLFSPHWQ
jgi:hypothetical protein